MSKFKNYIRHLQQKPEHQREKIAIAATAVSFAIVFVIWLVSFNEMNKSSESETSSGTSAAADSLKDNLGNGAKSIQEMLQRLPSEEDINELDQPVSETENIESGSENIPNFDTLKGDGENSEGNMDAQNTPDARESSQSSDEVPELP